MSEEKKYLPEEVESYEELKKIFEDFHIDSEKTRFYIGQDYTEPKAFVIYQDDMGDFVVYKMKADGTRALRYKGDNEAFAVNEYYQKFLEEVRKRPAFAKKLLPNEKVKRNLNRQKNNEDVIGFVMLFVGMFISIFLSAFNILPKWVGVVLFMCINPGIFIWLFINFVFLKNQGNFLPPKWFTVGALIVVLNLGVSYKLFDGFNHRKDGYYKTSDKVYYRKGRDMYYYNNSDWWYYGTYSDFDDYYDNWDYYDTYTYNDQYGDFRDSSYYRDDNDDSSWDSWDSGGWSDNDSWDSWDSGGTDWDSDW